jgi:hypothetical protein
MSADKQDGLMRANPTGLACTYAQLVTRRNHNPSDLHSWVGLTGMLYVLGIGKRHSFSCGKVDTPRSTCFRHLEGSFPTGGEFVEPVSVQYSP